jgi:hypothetical protein
MDQFCCQGRFELFSVCNSLMDRNLGRAKIFLQLFFEFRVYLYPWLTRIARSDVARWRCEQILPPRLGGQGRA